eukprot:scaffold311415_cov21-Tisochrysis_lutea.AAC.1
MRGPSLTSDLEVRLHNKEERQKKDYAFQERSPVLKGRTPPHQPRGIAIYRQVVNVHADPPLWRAHLSYSKLRRVLATSE